MIARYSTPEMTRLWSDENKFKVWLEIELAVLEAKAELGIIPREVFEKIKRQAIFSLWKVEEYEKELGHDMLAFVTSIREHLDEDLPKYFHAGVTSYDIEDPAGALIIRQAFEIIFETIQVLAEKLKAKAVEYKHTPMMGRTHGQHAEPITVGLKFLWWYDDILQQKKTLYLAYDELVYTKISGAVGAYGTGLSPELEWRALRSLNLFPAPTSRQIMLRCRHANVLNALATLAGVLENIALNIRLLAQTEIGEFQEPFGLKQKGSSRMPHKINTTRTENLDGLSTVVRGYAGTMLEHIKTWGEHSIEHSSVERIVFPDAFQLVHYMLLRLGEVTEGLLINKNNVAKNLAMTQGVIFSPEVTELLSASDLDPDTAYRISQGDAFTALSERRPYLEVLLSNTRIPEELKRGKLQQVFDIDTKLRHIDTIFARFGI